MQHLPTGLLVACLALVCAVDDRLIGWGGFGRTKPVIGTALALAGLAYVAGLPPVAVGTFPIAFMIWRTPDWHLLGGSINPAPSKAFGTFARHLLTLAFLLPAYWAGVSVAWTAVCMAVFAVVATMLALWNYEKQGHPNAWVETLRGLALGLLLAVPFIILRSKA